MSRSSSTSTISPVMRSAKLSPTASTTSLPTTDLSASASITTPRSSRVTSIEAWWKQVGEERYPEARELFITADAGGSNSYRSHVWKHQLQRIADKLGLVIHVSHFPPGTSKWNKVEHRLFSFISINWRGRPLRSYETVIQPDQQHDQPRWPGGPRPPRPSAVSDWQESFRRELKGLNIEPDDFHGDWNYVIRPRPKLR